MTNQAAYEFPLVKKKNRIGFHTFCVLRLAEVNESKRLDSSAEVRIQGLQTHLVKKFIKSQENSKENSKECLLKKFLTLRDDSSLHKEKFHRRSLNAYNSKYAIRKMEDNNEDYDVSLWWSVLSGIQGRRINHVAFTWRIPFTAINIRQDACRRWRSHKFGGKNHL